MTINAADQSDLYLEEISDDGTQYFFNGTWNKLEIIEQKINIKGKEPFNFKLKFTHRGPVVDFV